jgi:hypothetical protein
VFAEHTWIAVKPRGASAYTVYQIKGWLLREQGIAPLEIADGVPDRYWMGSPPRLLFDLRGPAAQRAIDGIQRAVASYPYRHTYRVWPGPNSNTFTACIARAVPELRLVLPVTAVGREYLPGGAVLARSPGGGYQLSLGGIAGLAVGAREGLECSLLGLAVRIDPRGQAVELPGLGRLAAGGNPGGRHRSAPVP